MKPREGRMGKATIEGPKLTFEQAETLYNHAKRQALCATKFDQSECVI